MTRTREFFQFFFLQLEAVPNSLSSSEMITMISELENELELAFQVSATDQVTEIFFKKSPSPTNFGDQIQNSHPSSCSRLLQLVKISDTDQAALAWSPNICEPESILIDPLAIASGSADCEFFIHSFSYKLIIESRYIIGEWQSYYMQKTGILLFILLTSNSLCVSYYSLPPFLLF